MRITLPALLLMLLGSCGLAQNIAYTVQVVAVSDQAQAFSLIRELGVEGYPAYATRATTGQGDVVRVRVGGFANRAAALLYAETMPDFPAPGSRPLPALADNIPAGVMPFEPRLLLDTSRSDFRLLTWGEGLAVEFAAEPGAPTEYTLIQAGATVSFEAWRAWREPDGLVLRYRDLPLWPDNWQDLTVEQRETEQALVLEFAAARLLLSPGDLAAAVRQREGEPVLVVLERFNPWQSVAVGQLLAVTLPAGGSAWQGDHLGAAVPEPEPEVLLAEPASLSGQAVSGEGWTVTPDGPFMLQSTPQVTRSWRAAVGTPLWTDGSHLLARHQERLLIYDFVERP